MKHALTATWAPVTIVQPSLFMDNLLTRWVKPHLLAVDEFAYPHAEDLDVSWISLDHVARFMIAAAERGDCEGETIDIGGSEALRPTDVAQILGHRLGRRIRYRRLSPREFGARMYEVLTSSTDVDRDTYVPDLVEHYRFLEHGEPVPRADARHQHPLLDPTGVARGMVRSAERGHQRRTDRFGLGMTDRLKGCR